MESLNELAAALASCGKTYNSVLRRMPRLFASQTSPTHVLHQLGVPSGTHHACAAPDCRRLPCRSRRAQRRLFRISSPMRSRQRVLDEWSEGNWHWKNSLPQ
jgi:hypothetical protein